MADDVQTDVKSGVESSTASTEDSSVKTPVGEQSTTKAESEKVVPYDRFQEVIKQKNQERQLREGYEAKIRELESRHQSSGTPSVDPQIKKLVDKGVKEDVAREIVEANRAAIQSELKPLADRERVREVRSWHRELQKNDPDYKQVEPELEKAFNSLSEDERMLAVSSQKGLEWFYKAVKSEVMQGKVSKAREAGVKEGYENKALKEGMASGAKSASGTDGAITIAKIKAMTPEEYKKRLPEINLAISSGKLK